MDTIIRTIIIDNNSQVVNNLKAHFESNERIKIINTFDNGENALQYILSHEELFDLIIMDILVPGLDGLAILEELRKKNINKKVIVLSSYKNENIIKTCSDYNVSYYLIKPFSISSLEKRILDIKSYPQPMNKISENLDLEVSQILHNLGIPSHIRGYKYIRDGVMILFNNSNISLITKEIYPQIAYKYETTPSRVERAIRHAIEVSWIRGDLVLMEDLFGFSVSCDKAKPTNSEFLTTIADRIKLDNNY